MSSQSAGEGSDGASVEGFAEQFDRMVANIEQAVLGKTHLVRLTLTCLVAGGHVLLEDYPGTGKTMLARALANTMSGSHARIQFTPDLLPSDVTGVTVFDQHSSRFDFHPGAVFHNLLLADEINRASPKTQSALLEVMEEGHVTVDGVTHAVPQPFMVIATQNPIEQAGTYRLPEAQLDRFLIKASVGYPDAESTEALLRSSRIRDRAALVSPVVDGGDVMMMGAQADEVFVDDSIIGYVRRLAEATRDHREVRVGLSPRGALALVRVAKVWAASEGRAHVVPQDIATLSLPVLNHRLILRPEAVFGDVAIESVIDDVVASVAAPTGRG